MFYCKVVSYSILFCLHLTFLFFLMFSLGKHTDCLGNKYIVLVIVLVKSYGVCKLITCMKREGNWDFPNWGAHYSLVNSFLKRIQKCRSWTSECLLYGSRRAFQKVLPGLCRRTRLTATKYCKNWRRYMVQDVPQLLSGSVSCRRLSLG